ncbi:predicted protein [Lichtheimia corymbifera JMRC:FSU:9682]|uniref:Uncharacterized protein n=1 Tax=Lichtheimia corymbifera JMRC:FSU:9682 TaxID=1263082 RepID=A0A068RDX9_9FUNG|nr:predicted protein [Lichtheimia corymbifera JMRC:FSU:9682]
MLQQFKPDIEQPISSIFKLRVPTSLDIPTTCHSKEHYPIIHAQKVSIGRVDMEQHHSNRHLFSRFAYQGHASLIAIYKSFSNL